MKIELDEVLWLKQQLRDNLYNTLDEIMQWNEDWAYYIKIKNEFRLKYKVNSDEFILQGK